MSGCALFYTSTGPYLNVFCKSNACNVSTFSPTEQNVLLCNCCILTKIKILLIQDLDSGKSAEHSVLLCT